LTDEKRTIEAELEQAKELASTTGSTSEQQLAAMITQRQKLDTELEKARVEAITLEQQSAIEKSQIVSDFEIERGEMIAEFEEKEERFLSEIKEVRALVEENSFEAASLRKKEEEKAKEELANLHKVSSV
jgi:hypothetical protein